MARYRATMKGRSALVSSIGNDASGIRTETNGWDVGVTVASCTDDDDSFAVYATGGSNANTPDIFLGIVSLDDNGRPIFTPSRG